jgi:hypothetical protein
LYALLIFFAKCFLEKILEPFAQKKTIFDHSLWHIYGPFRSKSRRRVATQVIFAAAGTRDCRLSGILCVDWPRRIDVEKCAMLWLPSLAKQVGFYRRCCDLISHRSLAARKRRKSGRMSARAVSAATCDPLVEWTAALSLFRRPVD